MERSKQDLYRREAITEKMLRRAHNCANLDVAAVEYGNLNRLINSRVLYEFKSEEHTSMLMIQIVCYGSRLLRVRWVPSWKMNRSILPDPSNLYKVTSVLELCGYFK